VRLTASSAGEACDDGNVVEDDMCTSACVPAACGDAVVQTNEACDDGNVDTTDACIACSGGVWRHIRAGGGGGVRTTACRRRRWLQRGVRQGDAQLQRQLHDRVVPAGGPDGAVYAVRERQQRRHDLQQSVHQVRHDENAVPASHNGNDLVTWCMQLGFATFSGEVSYGDRPCDAPQGKVFGCIGYDDPAVWHWCDWEDGTGTATS
jgi:cysteine-rich repeat protein